MKPTTNYVLIYDPMDKAKRKLIKQFESYADAVSSFIPELGINQCVMPVKLWVKHLTRRA